MTRRRKAAYTSTVLALIAALAAGTAHAQGVTVDLGQGGVSERALQLVALITVLSIAPSILIMVTSFTRIVVVLSLLRAGKIEATSKGQTIESTTGVEARETFSNNNIFRQASFRPKKGIEFAELVKASEAFRDTFGSEVKELNATAIVAELRREVARQEDTVATAAGLLTANRLPGVAVLEGALGQMKAVLRGSEDNAIALMPLR